MPTQVIDIGKIKIWPTDYPDTLLQVILGKEKLDIENMIARSSIDMKIDFDVEVFSDEGLEELEKIKDMNIFTLLDKMGDVGRDALKDIKDTTAFEKYKNFTLKDILEDDYKRNKLVGYNVFAYEQQEDDWVPTTVLGTRQLESGQRMKGVPDLNWENLNLKIDETGVKVADKSKDLFDIVKDNAIVDFIIPDLEEIQIEHMKKYYDNLAIVDTNRKTNTLSKKIKFNKKKMKEEILKTIAGSFNPSIIGDIKIRIIKDSFSDDTIEATLEVSHTERRRIEVAPFGVKESLVTQRVTEDDFRELLDENKGSIPVKNSIQEPFTILEEGEKVKLDFSENITLGDIQNLDNYVDVLFGKETIEGAYDETIHGDRVKYRFIMRTLNRLKAEYMGKSGAKPSRTTHLEGYKVNKKMDDILQDIEERYVELEDDVENAVDFLEGDD